VPRRVGSLLPVFTGLFGAVFTVAAMTGMRVSVVGRARVLMICAILSWVHVLSVAGFDLMIGGHDLVRGTGWGICRGRRAHVACLMVTGGSIPVVGAMMIFMLALMTGWVIDGVGQPLMLVARIVMRFVQPFDVLVIRIAQILMPVVFDTPAGAQFVPGARLIRRRPSLPSVLNALPIYLARVGPAARIEIVLPFLAGIARTKRGGRHHYSPK